MSPERNLYRRLQDRIGLVPRLLVEQSARLDELSARVESLSQRLDGVSAHVDGLTTQAGGLVRGMAELAARLAMMSELQESFGGTLAKYWVGLPGERTSLGKRDGLRRAVLVSLLQHRSMLKESRERATPAEPMRPPEGGGAEVSCWVFWGDRISFESGDWLGEQLRRDQFLEAGLTEFIIRHLDGDDVFFDVGAHLGYYSILSANLVADPSQIHAFEPTGKVFRTLERNCRHLEGIHLNNIAVWSATGEISFTELGDTFSAFNSAVSPRLTEMHLKYATPVVRTVPAESLDDYCARTGTVPGFVKVDVESAEMEVLKGMKGLLADARPVVTLEVGDFDLPNVPPSRVLVDTMLGAGYRAFEHSDGEIRPHVVRDRYGYDNILFLPSAR